MDNKKKYYVMFGSIIGIILFLLICMMLLSSCSKKGSYDKLEKKLVEGAQECISNNDVTVTEGTSTMVTSDQLISAGYIKSLDKYIPYVSCSNYTTVSLKDKIVEDNLVTKDAGLYYEDGEYIFKGKNPNNVVKFDGSTWLIIKIDNNGNLKLVSIDSSKQAVAWDNKYNEDTNYTTGENEYETSNIHDILTSKYEGYNSDNKKHLVPFSLCIGKRTNDSVAKTAAVDCAEKIDNQYFGLINPSDYANASYDKDCVDIVSGSCINFNYLYNNLSETWTANAIGNDSFEVILYSPGRIRRVDARESHYYNIVIYISGDEKYISGNGTAADPYVIK